MDAPNLNVSVNPHRSEGESIPLIMWTVVLALIPAGVVGVYVFGWRALYVTLVSAIACVLTEYVIQKMRGVKVTVSDGSAAVTGILLAYTLPPNVSAYVIVVGAVIAIGIAKQAFGGLGANFFNPALLARAFLQFSFPNEVSLSNWPILKSSSANRLLADCADATDGITTATPLNILQTNPGVAWSELAPNLSVKMPMIFVNSAPIAITLLVLLIVGAIFGVVVSRKSRTPVAGTIGVGALILFALIPMGSVSLGQIPGSLGETSVWAILLGGLMLIATRCINWQLPASYILTTALLVLVLPVTGVDGKLVFGFENLEVVLVHIFSGGLFLGAFFMITDMVTSPITIKGQVYYGILAGILVTIIRLYGGFPEGVCFSILLVNAARPLFDKYIVPRVFGASKKKAAA